MKKAIILTIMHSCLFVKASLLKHKVDRLQKEDLLVSSNTKYITTGKQIPKKYLIEQSIQQHSTINKSLLENLKCMHETVYKRIISSLECEDTTAKIVLPKLEELFTKSTKNSMDRKSALMHNLCTQLADHIENMHKLHAMEIENLIAMFKSEKDMTCEKIANIVRLQEMNLRLQNIFFSQMKRETLSQLDHSLTTEKEKLKIEKEKIAASLERKEELWKVTLEQKRIQSEFELAMERELYEEMWISEISKRHAQLDIEEEMQEIASQNERIKMFEELKAQERAQEIALEAEREKASQALKFKAQELNRNCVWAEEMIEERKRQDNKDIKELIKNVKIFQTEQDRYNLEMQRIIRNSNQRLKDPGAPPKYQKVQGGKSIIGVNRAVLPT